MKQGFRHLKATDREILLRLSDKDLIKTCSLNKYLYISLCDDDFFRRKLTLSYPDTLQFFNIEKYKTYKRYYLHVVYYVSKMLEKFKYSYVSGNPQKQFNIFKGVNYGHKFPESFEKSRQEELLLSASREGELNLVIEAIEKGANIHADSEKALRTASYNGRLGIMKYLVALGADIHANDELALRSAVEAGQLGAVKYLVNLGADVHANNEEALLSASYHGNLEIVKYLVSKGANIHANNDEALKLANDAGHLEIVKYLLSNTENNRKMLGY